MMNQPRARLRPSLGKMPLGLLLILALLGCTERQRDSDGLDALQLTVHSSVQLPTKFVALGAVAWRNRLATFGADGRVFELDGSNWRERKAPGDFAAIAVGFDDDGDLRVLDRLGRSHKFSSAGEYLQFEQLQLPSSPDQFLLSDRTWFATTINGDSTSSVVRVGSGDSDSILHTPPIDDGSTSVRSRLIVQRSKKGVVIVERFYPFTIREIDRTGKLLREVLPRIDRASSLPKDALDRLIALAIVGVDNSMLLTLGELTSLRRALVVLDKSGVARRYRELEMPIVFTTATDEYVVSIRRLGDTQDVLLHKWAWVNPQSSR